MTERIIGYSLLAVGIILMIISTIQIIFIFTGRAKPIQFFKTEKQTVQSNSQQSLDAEDLLERVQTGDLSALLNNSGNTIPELNIISPETINQILNLTVFYFLMQFLLSLGYKLASLGVQMIRPLKVEVRQNKLASIIAPDTETSS